VEGFKIIYMSRRNIILLIIILVIVGAVFFGFLFFRQNTATPGTNSPGTNFISQFNPFGNGTTKPPATTPPPVVTENPPATTPVVPVKLKKVSSMPIAGFTVYPKERLVDVPVVVPATPAVDTITPVTGTTTTTTTTPTTTKVKPIPPQTEFAPSLRYVDRVTGNIYETFADKLEERKFSQTVIPKIYEAFLGNNGQSVVMRYLNTDGRTIETFVGNLPKEIFGGDTTENNEIKGTLLPENIKDASMSSDKGSLFYLFNVGNDQVGTTLNLTTNSKVQIFDSPFTEWLSQWPNSNLVTLTTKPASGIPGYMYATNPSNKILNQVLGNINGLTTLTSPDGKLVLYADDNLSLNVYHTDTKVSNLLGVKTLPEKCVWDKASDAVYCSVPKSISSAQYPDAWYQGEVSFSDQLWKIDIASGNTTILADPLAISGGEDIDGIKLALDDGENFLFFVNKKDSFLWEFGLK
jgi:hypothetical protein